MATTQPSPASGPSDPVPDDPRAELLEQLSGPDRSELHGCSCVVDQVVVTLQKTWPESDYGLLLNQPGRDLSANDKIIAVLFRIAQVLHATPDEPLDDVIESLQRARILASSEDLARDATALDTVSPDTADNFPANAPDIVSPDTPSNAPADPPGTAVSDARDTAISDATNKIRTYIFAAITALTQVAVMSESAKGFKTEQRDSFLQWDIARQQLSWMFEGLGNEIRAGKDSVPSNKNTTSNPGTTSNTDTTSNTNTTSNPYHIPTVKAASLVGIGNVKIVWVDSITAHLNFDPKTRELCLYRCASYCTLQKSAKSLLSQMSQPFLQTQTFHVREEFSDITVQQLMDEILSSYRLLFDCDQSSRMLFRKTERDKAAIQGRHGDKVFDLALDEACGLSKTDWSFSRFKGIFRRSEPYYDQTFRALHSKLGRLAEYMAKLEPNTIGDVWRDRRNMRSFYSFWMPILFGIVAILSLGATITGNVIKGSRKRATEQQAFGKQHEQLQDLDERSEKQYGLAPELVGLTDEILQHLPENLPPAGPEVTGPEVAEAEAEAAGPEVAEWEAGESEAGKLAVTVMGCVMFLLFGLIMYY